MTLPRLISRLLINSKHLDKNVASKLRKTKPSVELESYNSGYYAIHNYFSTSACLPTALSDKTYVNIFDPTRLNETQKMKALDTQNLWYISKRNKGHSKWQNIQHQKSANDLLISKRNQRFVNLIVSAIKENGNTTDPKYNSSLAKVIKDAQAEGVQKATIENAIKRSKNTEANAEFVFEVRGPGNTFIIIEAFAKKSKSVQTEISHCLNKAKCGLIDKGLINTFERQGVIVVKAIKDLTLDTAEEDAIECGAEEVVELDTSDDGSKIFQFQSSPIDFSVVKDAISVKETNGTPSYEILSANVNYVSVGQIVELDNKADEDAFKKLMDKLNESEMITGIYHNCSMEI